VVNAPVAVHNVPTGISPADAGRHIEKGVKEHLDYQNRTIERSNPSQVSY